MPANDEARRPQDLPADVEQQHALGLVPAPGICRFAIRRPDRARLRHDRTGEGLTHLDQLVALIGREESGSTESSSVAGDTCPYMIYDPALCSAESWTVPAVALSSPAPKSLPY